MASGSGSWGLSREKGPNNRWSQRVPNIMYSVMVVVPGTHMSLRAFPCEMYLIFWYSIAPAAFLQPMR